VHPLGEFFEQIDEALEVAPVRADNS